MGVDPALQATALVAAACRAQETRQRSPRLVDPWAEALSSTLDGAGLRLVAGGREEVVERTLHLDRLLLDLVARHPGCTVVNLGAGLCTRPYRLDLSACREVVEVDAPEVLSLKASVLDGARPSCPVRRVAGDLTASLPEVSGEIVYVTEGVLVYLTEEQVRTLAARLRGGVAWVADIVSRASAEAMSALAGRALTLHGLSSLSPLDGWTVADYRVSAIPRPGRSGSSREIVDGVLLLT